MATSRTPFPIIGSYDVERDVVLSGERTINLYVVPAKNTVEKMALVPASGFKNPFDVGDGPIRAEFVFKDKNYVVSGDEIYSVDTALIPTLIGVINSSSGYVGIDANESQVIFVDGVDGYYWDTIGLTFHTIVFPTTPFLPVDVTMLDNYFIVPNGGTITWYISNINDAATWVALNFANFESNPDQLQAVATLKRRLYLFGKISTEVWYDAGDPDFPFRRDNNSLFEHGCISPKSIREGFELLFYVANNKGGPAGVMMVAGVTNPRKISTKEVDIFLQNTSNIADAEGILYQENGLIFYQLSFNADNKTFVYVVNTDRWHELSLPNGDRHPAGCHVFFANKHLIGMFNDKKIYELSYKHYTYGEELIRCIRVSAPFFDPNYKRIRLDRFELETMPGLPYGTLPNQQIYPQLDSLIKENKSPDVILSVSRDGGRTFGNGRRARTGKLGQYNFRTLWTRLGVYKGRRIVIKLEFPYKVPFYILGAFLIYEVLPE